MILYMLNIFSLEGLARSLPSLTPAPSLHPPTSPSKYRCCHKFHEYITWKYSTMLDSWNIFHNFVSKFWIAILTKQASSLFPFGPIDRRSNCLHRVQKSLWGNIKHSSSSRSKANTNFPKSQVTGSREIGDAHRTQDKDPTGPAGYKVNIYKKHVYRVSGK